VDPSRRECSCYYNSCVNKNPVRSDGSLINCYSEKGTFTIQLRMASAFEEHCNQEKRLPSWIKTVNGGAKRAAADFIPRLDLSSVGSCFNSINLFPKQSGFGSPIAIRDPSTGRRQMIIRMAVLGL